MMKLRVIMGYFSFENPRKWGNKIRWVDRMSKQLKEDKIILTQENWGWRDNLKV